MGEVGKNPSPAGGGWTGNSDMTLFYMHLSDRDVGRTAEALRYRC